jgi:UDP-glucuronate 4-epimerase
MKILVTGAAGFIGFHAVKFFAESGNQVVGLDNINDYYDMELKHARLAMTGIDYKSLQGHKALVSTKYPGYRFVKADLKDKIFIDNLFATEHFDWVCHLAAQAGVRFSIDNPYTVINSNITGFLNILEACRHNPVQHLVYASSSSVYGRNQKIPYCETDMVDAPVSLYAASKKSNELMAHTYSALYRVPSTGIRFFTVYGPWGRPDMAPYLFMESIMNHVPIKVFNHGKHARDFTYIDDVIEGLSAIIKQAPVSEIPYRVLNLGAGNPIQLLDFIALVENITGKRAIKHMVEMQKGDVNQTFADTSKLEYNIHFKPHINIKDGIERFYKWYTSYTNNHERGVPFN